MYYKLEGNNKLLKMITWGVVCAERKCFLLHICKQFFKFYDKYLLLLHIETYITFQSNDFRSVTIQAN